MDLLNITKITVATAVAATILTISLTSPADARRSTRSMTCEAIEDILERRGSVVLNIKGNSIYRRFIADEGSCAFGETTKGITVRTKSGGCELEYCAPDRDD